MSCLTLKRKLKIWFKAEKELHSDRYIQSGILLMQDDLGLTNFGQNSSPRTNSSAEAEV
jgi:hypothetical protein